MFGTTVLRSLAAALAAGMLYFSYSSPTLAQAQGAPATQDEKMRILQQRIDDMSKQLKQLQDEQTKTSKTVSTVDKAWSTFIKGFFGTLDVSIDYTSKGMENMQAWHYICTGPDGGAPCTINTAAGPKAPPYGRVSWMAMMSSNGSNVGYRGSHQIGKSSVDFIYQVSTSIDMAAAPGLNNTWTKSSNTVTGALGLGDTYIGLRNKRGGTLKFGTMYTPYKTSTDRLNPFAGMLGNYSVVMGNTGGDNRIEFGTRMDHVIVYNSPNWGGFSLDASYGFGQNPDPFNNITPLQSSDCSGSNNPGSGNLFLNCDDGGFNYSYGGDLKFEYGGLYLVAAYELHSAVNRSSDGIGSNNPIYANIQGAGNLCGTVGPQPQPPNDPRLDCAPTSNYYLFITEYPTPAAAGSPPFNPVYDAVDEWAAKVGGQYHFQFGLTVSYLYEEMKRKLPDNMQFQNERQRTGQWAAIEYEFSGGANRIAAGWAHAGASTGDPGGQHNYDPNGIGQNTANMYTAAFWHKFDKQLTWYFNYAVTVNNVNAHYDIGAGSHGIKTDCHDATHASFIDYSSYGPTTWGGCRPQGYSTGLNYKF